MLQSVLTDISYLPSPNSSRRRAISFRGFITRAEISCDEPSGGRFLWSWRFVHPSRGVSATSISLQYHVRRRRSRLGLKPSPGVQDPQILESKAGQNSAANGCLGIRRCPDVTFSAKGGRPCQRRRPFLGSLGRVRNCDLRGLIM